MVRSLVVLGTDTSVLGVYLRSVAEQSNDYLGRGSGTPYPDVPSLLGPHSTLWNVTIIHPLLSTCSSVSSNGKCGHGPVTRVTPKLKA